MAQALEIPHYVMNFRQEFKCHVIDYFVEEYLQGRTPNPCIACNRGVKFAALLQRAKELGCQVHYYKGRAMNNPNPVPAY